MIHRSKSFERRGIILFYKFKMWLGGFSISILKAWPNLLTFILVFSCIISPAIFCGDKPSDLSKEKLYFSINEALQNKQKAYKLCLGGQELNSIQEDIGDLINLMELNISQNKIETLPESFCQLKNLTELKIPGNMFKKLPECISEFVNLKTLDLSNNPDLDKMNLFRIIYKLTSLESLDISFLELNEIPDGIENLKNLKDLNISGNNLNSKLIEKLKKILPKTIINS